MKNIVFILLGLLIAGCISQEKAKSINELGEVLEKVANKHNCKLTYKIMLSNEDINPLTLTLHSSIDYTATAGDIVEDCYLELSKKDIYYDRYILKNAEGRIGIHLSRLDLEKILKCKPVAQRIFKALENKEIRSVTSDLDSNNFTPDQIELVQKKSEEIIGEYKYIGFEVTVEVGALFVAYTALTDSVLFAVIVNLSNDNCKVFGINSRVISSN